MLKITIRCWFKQKKVILELVQANKSKCLRHKIFRVFSLVYCRQIVYQYIILLALSMSLICMYQIILINLSLLMSEKHKPGFMPWDRSGNRVLVQSSLGRNKPTNYEIPDEDFAYGKRTFQDPEKTNQVMYGWKYHQNSNNPNIEKNKDIIKTNMQAVKNLAFTAATNYNFRKTQTQYKKVKEGSKNIKIYLPQENFTYGKPGDLEDPIKYVLANQYGEQDKFMRHTLYQSDLATSQRQKRNLSCHITKNHNLAKEANAKRSALFDWKNRGKDYWKLSKFCKVDPRTSTVRSGNGFSISQYKAQQAQ